MRNGDSCLRSHRVLYPKHGRLPLHDHDVYRDVWFGNRLRGVSFENERNHRIRMLKGIASAMVQLAQFAFRHGGRPSYDGDGQLLGMGSIPKVDSGAITTTLWAMDLGLPRRPITPRSSCHSQTKTRLIEAPRN